MVSLRAESLLPAELQAQRLHLWSCRCSCDRARPLPGARAVSADRPFNGKLSHDRPTAALTEAYARAAKLRNVWVDKTAGAAPANFRTIWGGQARDGQPVAGSYRKPVSG